LVPLLWHDLSTGSIILVTLVSRRIARGTQPQTAVQSRPAVRIAVRAWVGYLLAVWCGGFLWGAVETIKGKLSRNLLISPFKSRNRPGQVPGTSDASKTQLGLIKWNWIVGGITSELPVPLPTCLSPLSMPRNHVDGPPLYGLTVPNLPNVA